MISKKDIPDTSVLDNRLEEIAQEMLQDSNYINNNFQLHGAARQGWFSRFFLLNYEHKTQGVFLGLLAVPVKGGMMPVAVDWYNAVEASEHDLVLNHYYQRSGARNSEMWGVNHQIVTLKPENPNDSSTVPELDLGGIRHKLNNGIKMQGLITTTNQNLR